MDPEEASIIGTATEKTIMTVRVLITGRVQKVGFRACVRRFASSLAVSGEVMNLEDGRVLLRATAEPVVIEKFLSSLYGCPRARIREMDIKEVPRREYDNFTIQRGMN